MNLTKRLLKFGIPILICGGILLAAAPAEQRNPFQNTHPAIGSWFGQAVQVCPPGTPGTAACPEVALFMTPTINQDLTFVAGDTLELGGPPFGPHTTAHGQWEPTSPTDIIADYVFMLPGTTSPLTVQAIRFRWEASVTSFNTLQGYVNAYFGPNVPVAWQDLSASLTTFPTLPSAAFAPLTPPQVFYKDPTACPSGPPACPLMFRFTIMRIAP